MINYKILTPFSLTKIAKKMRYTIVNCSKIYEKFYYFNIESIGINSKYKHIFFTAFNEKELIALLKFSQSPTNKENIWIISWIDVREDYREKGIATELIRKLNEYVKGKNFIIINTPLSEMGKVCKLNNLMRKIIVNCPFYQSELEYFNEYINKKTIS